MKKDFDSIRKYICNASKHIYYRDGEFKRVIITKDFDDAFIVEIQTFIGLSIRVQYYGFKVTTPAVNKLRIVTIKKTLRGAKSVRRNQFMIFATNPKQIFIAKLKEAAEKLKAAKVRLNAIRNISRWLNETNGENLVYYTPAKLKQRYAKYKGINLNGAEKQVLLDLHKFTKE